MNELLEQQRAFVKRVFDEQGSDRQDFDVKGSADKKGRPAVLALKQDITNRFTDTQRFQIYRNNIFISLREALSGVYPVINKLVGDEFFQQVAREYIHRHPASDGNVHEFGAEFPGFLAEFPGAYGLAYLPDVARLEWAHHEIFHAPQAGVLNIQALASLDEAAHEHLRFQVSTSCRLLSSNYPVLHIWQANQQGHEDEVVDLDEGGMQLVVMRSGFDVVFRPLNKAVFALLDALSENRLFTDACAEAIAIDPNCDIGAILNDLIAQRLLTGFSCSSVETGIETGN
jgi:hypothetical protein